MTSTISILPRPVQDYLGQQLRATYLEVQDKPAYLGDPALPPEFDQYIHRLASIDYNQRRAQQCGLAAVAAAMHFHSTLSRVP